jgi:hypothetical protein
VRKKSSYENRQKEDEEKIYKFAMPFFAFNFTVNHCMGMCRVTSEIE